MELGKGMTAEKRVQISASRQALSRAVRLLCFVLSPSLRSMISATLHQNHSALLPYFSYFGAGPRQPYRDRDTC